MKSLFLKLLLLLMVMQNSFGQYVKFAGVDGFRLSKGAVITSIATAGGGVVLVGVAKPKYPESVGVFTDVTFIESSNMPYMSIMKIHTEQSIGYFVDSLWLMRDAAMLVNSETKDMYRNINLLGTHTSNESQRGLDKTYPGSIYYVVEMSESLVGTRSGQTLLYTDLIISGIENSFYYSSDEKVFDDYYETRMKLVDDFVTEIRNRLKSNGKNVDSIFIDELIPKNYTYNDESADYLFYFNKLNSGVGSKLVIEGAPRYDFLTDAGSEYKVNSYFTNYYIKNFYLIKNLNKIVFANAERFSQAAAFFRYLKNEYPHLWHQVVSHYENAPRRKGDTPRFIEICPISKTCEYE